MKPSEYGFIKRTPILIFIIMTQNLIILVPNISIGAQNSNSYLTSLSDKDVSCNKNPLG